MTPPPVSTPPDHSAALEVNRDASLFLNGHGSVVPAQNASADHDSSADSVVLQHADDPVERPAHSSSNKSGLGRSDYRPELEPCSKHTEKSGLKNIPDNQILAMYGGLASKLVRYCLCDRVEHGSGRGADFGLQVLIGAVPACKD